MENLKVKKKVLGYMPVQIANLSLEEIELKKNIEVGIASPIEIDGERCRGTYVESPVSEDSSTSPVTRVSRETVQDFSRNNVSQVIETSRKTVNPVIGTSGKTVPDFDMYSCPNTTIFNYFGICG